MNEIFENIIKAIAKAESSESVSGELLLRLKFKDSDICSDCKKLIGGVDIEEVQKNSFSIVLKQSTFSIFIDIEDYRTRLTKDFIVDGNFKTNILILKNEDSKPMFFIKDTFETFIDGQKDLTNFLFINSISYFRLIHFLKENEHKEDKHFYFVDYFNIDYRKIIITSLKKEGKLTIGYPMLLPDFDSKKSIKPEIERFIGAFKEKQLPKFIKAELFNYLPAFKQEERLVAFIHNMNVIMEKAEQNFEIYLSDLSLDEFKNRFLEFRIKYFNQFRDILSKITTQILAFPLSITASVFATYKTLDSILLCSLIVAAFVIFSIYSLYTLKAHKSDVVELKRLFETDYISFSTNPFFKKYPNELSSFEETKDYIFKRSAFLITCINIYSWVLITTNLFFILFIGIQFLEIKIALILLIILILLILSFLLFYFLFN
jgi:hypothetical protein